MGRPPWQVKLQPWPHKQEHSSGALWCSRHIQVHLFKGQEQLMGFLCGHFSMTLLRSSRKWPHKNATYCSCPQNNRSENCRTRNRAPDERSWIWPYVLRRPMLYGSSTMIDQSCNCVLSHPLLYLSSSSILWFVKLDIYVSSLQLLGLPTVIFFEFKTASCTVSSTKIYQLSTTVFQVYSHVTGRPPQQTD